MAGFSSLRPMVDLSVAFFIGLLGSGHCVGMCGGFMALLGHARSGQRVWVGQTLYLAGKAFTYTVMGAAAGWLGGAALGLSGFQGVISVVLGVVLVLIGLGLCGVLAVAPVSGRVSSYVAQRFRPAITRLVRNTSAPSLAGLGAINGLLPCGLVYGMLAKAATTGSVADGALTLAVFGLGTAPTLLLVGTVGAAIPPARRLWLQRAGGVLVIALGLLTVTRAAMAFVDPTTASGNHDVLCLP